MNGSITPTYRPWRRWMRLEPFNVLQYFFCFFWHQPPKNYSEVILTFWRFLPLSCKRLTCVLATLPGGRCRHGVFAISRERGNLGASNWHAGVSAKWLFTCSMSSSSFLKGHRSPDGRQPISKQSVWFLNTDTVSPSRTFDQDLVNLLILITEQICLIM